MSVTFSIEGISEERGYELPCQGCGVSTIQAMAADERRHWGCMVCAGYGGAADADMPRPRFELNVSNASALLLLRFLNLPADWHGAVPAIDVVLAVALNWERRHELCSSETQSGNVITCARSREQVDNYFRTLTRIARKAQRYGRRVIWS